METAETVEAVEEVAVEAPASKPAKKQSSRKSTRNGLLIGLALAVLVVVGVIVGKGYYDQNRGERIASGLHTNGFGYESYAVHYEIDADDKVTYSYMNQDRETVRVSAKSVEKLMDE